MTCIEKLLKEKTDQTNNEILYAQWIYDKEVAEKTLQLVGMSYPHYTNHDSSHSKKILENIVRIMGIERISLLSQTDLWLILEVAYYHDIGMVLSANQINQVVTEKEFVKYVENIQENQNHSLYKFSKFFEINNGKILFINNDYELIKENAMKYLIANFFRTEHGELSKKIIKNPEGYLSVYRNKNLLIPERFFTLIGEISAVHTKEFKDIFNLSKVESGFSIDDCHPRYIACLLRLADLLDMDNNRYNIFNFNMLVELPEDSLNHINKHFSIKNLRIDTERIDAYAECQDYEVYFLIQDWFNWIEEEVSNQMLNWNDIVPTKEMGLLPTIGRLEIKLKDYDLINEKERPQFSIDLEKGLELFQGAGIYSNSFQAFREILQNAVDATLIRIWEENKNKELFEFKDIKRIKEKVNSKYPINVKIDFSEYTENKNIWKCVIHDRGIGIEKSELTFLTKAGSSPRNSRKKNTIKEMPEWLKPSGIFGIGFQSIFLVTDKIKIKSRSYYGNEVLEVIMHSPNEGKIGKIFLKTLPANYSDEPGTTIEFFCENDKIPEGYSISFYQKLTHEILAKFDPILHESLDIEMGQIIDEISEFGMKSPIPIELEWNSDLKELNDKIDFQYLSKNGFFEVNIHKKTNRNKIYYRNQKIDKAESIFSQLLFIKFEINLLSSTAKELLTLNRNDINDNSKYKLEDSILNALYEVILDNFEDICKDANDFKYSLSMFLEYYKNFVKKELSDRRLEFEHWKEYTMKSIVDNYNENETIYDFLEKNKKCELKIENIDNEIDTICKVEYCNTEKKLSIMGNRFEDEIEFYIFKIDDNYKYCRIEKFLSEYDNTKTLNYEETDSITNEGIKGILERLKISSHTSRVILPCMNEYKNLEINDDIYVPYALRYDKILLGRFENKNAMLLPYFFKEEQRWLVSQTKEIQVIELEKVIQWVYKNRKNSDVTLEQIRESYGKFIKEFAPIIENN